MVSFGVKRRLITISETRTTVKLTPHSFAHLTNSIGPQQNTSNQNATSKKTKMRDDMDRRQLVAVG